MTYTLTDYTIDPLGTRRRPADLRTEDYMIRARKHAAVDHGARNARAAVARLHRIVSRVSRIAERLDIEVMVTHVASSDPAYTGTSITAHLWLIRRVDGLVRGEVYLSSACNGSGVVTAAYLAADGVRRSCSTRADVIIRRALIR